MCVCACVYVCVLPVAKGRDEVQAAVHSVVLDVLAVQRCLVHPVCFKLLLYVIVHLHPTAPQGNTQHRSTGNVHMHRHSIGAQGTCI